MFWLCLVQATLPAIRSPSHDEERRSQRAVARSQQRATAAAAQVAQPDSEPAFPRKDPTKQPLLVAGSRMIDIRVGHPTESRATSLIELYSWTFSIYFILY